MINSYKITSNSVSFDGSDPTYLSITDGVLQNGKLYSETYQLLEDGVVVSTSELVQRYFYNNDLLIKTVLRNGDDVKNFFYDLNHELIGINWLNDNVYNYYRFVKISTTVYYVEKITSSYDDVNADVIRRSIVEFDNDDNIIRAGLDRNLDGVMEQFN